MNFLYIFHAQHNGAVRGKTGKTSVLVGFREIELSGGSGD